MKRKINVLSGILLSAMLLGGCGSNGDLSKSDSGNESEGNTTKITFWHTYSDTEEAAFLNNVLPLFNEKHPEIEVEAVRMPTDGLKQQVITALSGGVQPDVMRMDVTWTPEFAKMGALEALDDKEGFKEIEEAVYEAPLATNIYEGTYYGLPLNTNTKAMAWNIELLNSVGLSEAPKTIEEFETVAAQIVSEDIWAYGMQSPDAWGAIPIFYSMGGSFTDEEFTKAEGYANSAQSVAALEKIVEWYEKGYIGPSVFGEEPNTWGGLENGQYLVIDDGPWLFSLTEYEGKYLPGKILEGEGGSVSVVGGENIVNFSASENKEAAWEFTKFMLSEEAQLGMIDGGIVPVLKSCMENESVKNNEITSLYLEQIETAVPRAVHPSFNKMNEAIQLTFDKALRKEGNAQELLDQLSGELEKIINE